MSPSPTLLSALSLVAAIATVPLLPWFLARVSDTGAATSLAALAVAGVLLIHRRGRSAPPSSWLAAAAAVAVAVGVLGVLLPARSPLWAAATITAGAGFSVHTRSHRPLVAGALLAVAAVHPLDLDAFVGWPLRLAFARIAAVLTPAADAPLTASSILVVEGRVADVEAACAGVRSILVLFIGMAALIASRPATSLSRAAAAAAAAFGVFVVASVGRIVAIVTLALVVKRPELADAIHGALGMAAFVAALLCAHGILAGGGAVQLDDQAPRVVEVEPPRSAPRLGGALVTALALAVIVVVAGQVKLASVDRSGAPSGSERSPGEDVTTALGIEAPLLPAERALFAKVGARALKRVFRDGSSALIVVGGRGAHHAPERCLAAAGFVIDTVADLDIDGVSARSLTIVDPRTGAGRASLATFVSPAMTTSSIGERVARGLAGEEPWALVSVIGDDRDSAAVHFIDAVAVARRLLPPGG